MAKWPECSIEAVLKEVEAIAVGMELNALKLLDGNADAKTLHVTSFGPSYAAACPQVTFCQ
jgi:hypothetical protein